MRREYSLETNARNRRPRKPLEIAMTPMIDIIFLLLVFFLATSSFQMVEQLLPSGVSEMEPNRGSMETPPEETSDDALDQVVIRLLSDAEQTRILLNNVALNGWEELRTRLDVVGSSGQDIPVIIDPDGEIEATEVIRAYDWAREAGMLRVYLATRVP